jgi:tetratricopeptide (TPR) repeat protein
MRALLPLCLTAALSASASAATLDELARAIEQSPDDAKAYDAYAYAAFKEKKFDEAIRKLKVGVARIPDYAEGYYKLAYAYRQRQEWADAADYYRRYIALRPAKVDPYYGLAASLEGLGDKKGAIAAFEKYIELERAPEKQRFVEQARKEIALLRGAAPPAPAAAPAAPASAAAPARPRGDAKQLRAEAEQLKKQGKLVEAAQAYERALPADEGNLELYNDLGNVYVQLKQYGDAARVFQAAVDRDKAYALGWYNLAYAQRKANKMSEAAAAYRAYSKLRPEDPDPYYGLGQALKALGDVKGAIEAFKVYIATEQRPDEQRWVEKAKLELEMLEAMQRSSPPSGKLRDHPADEEPVASASDRLERELRRDRILPLGDDGLINPFARPGERAIRSSAPTRCPRCSIRRPRWIGCASTAPRSRPTGARSPVTPRTSRSATRAACSSRSPRTARRRSACGTACRSTIRRCARRAGASSASARCWRPRSRISRYLGAGCGPAGLGAAGLLWSAPSGRRR